MKKIQITIDQPNINGYIYASPDNKELKQDFIELSQFATECEVSEIYAPEILDALTSDNITKYITEWISLLKVGGKLIIGGTDIYLLSKMIIHRNIDLKTLNELLFKRSYFIRSFSSIEHIRGFLEAQDLYITNISTDYSASSFTIEAKKIHV